MVLRAAPVTSCELPGVAPSASGFAYDRRRPELHALHKAVRISWPQLQERIADHPAAALPKFVVKGFEAYLTCGQLAAGFCRVGCIASCDTHILWPSLSGPANVRNQRRRSCGATAQPQVIEADGSRREWFWLDGHDRQRGRVDSGLVCGWLLRGEELQTA